MEVFVVILDSIVFLTVFALGLLHVLLALIIISEKTRLRLLDLSIMKKIRLWLSGLSFLKRVGFRLDGPYKPFTRIQKAWHVPVLSIFAILYIGMSVFGFYILFSNL